MPKTRHSRKGFGALAAWMHKPALDEPIAPTQTNWSTVPANDNVGPEEHADLFTDKQREMTPSIAEIRREMTGAIVRGEPTTGYNGEAIPGPIIAIGKLQFSDGRQTERCYMHGPEGKLIQHDALMPVGAMMHTRERLTRDKGGAQSTTINPSRLAEIFRVEHRPHVPGRRNSGGRSYTAAESKDTLAAAYANTPVLPPVTKCPPGLACASADPSSGFVGMSKGKKGESGSITWEDISSMLAMREIWAEAAAALAAEDEKALDAAMTAKNLREIGEAHGFVGKRAERMGKQILLGANDNLQNILKKAAA